MRKRGTVTRWDDDRGFGFITPKHDGDAVFVHVKAVAESSRRPQAGDIVSYELTRDAKGRPRAKNVRLGGRTRDATSPRNRRDRGSPAVALTLIFACFLVVAALFGRLPWWLVLGCVVASVLTFAVYARDKSSARRGNWRTAESTLHLLGLLGGWPGALAAQRLLRHKSSKKEFQFMFRVTALLNVAAIAYVAWRGDTRMLEQWLEEILRTLAR